MREIQLACFRRLANVISRATIDTPSKWALEYRKMGAPIPGSWTFKYHPWLREMHDSVSPMNIGQKGAQQGYTETMLNLAFFAMDVQGVSVLYILPNNRPDASDFSSDRFDGALELSPHLAEFFSNVKNVGHKRAGSTNLYIRGSKSRAALKSVPVARLFFDEYDEMPEANIPLAMERLSGQQGFTQVWKISTPTVPGYGVNKDYVKSTEEHFFFKCPACNRRTELTFPECLVIPTDDPNDPEIANSYLQCKECTTKLDHQTKHIWLKDGIWIPKRKAVIRGFHTPQLYSSADTCHPSVIATQWLKAQTSPADEQEFYNSKLGLPHLTEGAAITDAMIDAAKRDYKNNTRPTQGQMITMGIDVGTWLHVEICQWYVNNAIVGDLNSRSTCRVLSIQKVKSIDDISRLMSEYQVRHAIIDNFPETRMATNFSLKFKNYVHRCYYPNAVAGKDMRINGQDFKVGVDRSSWLDLSLGRFYNKTIELPSDLPHDYREHIKSQVRKYEKDLNGNPIAKYISLGDDHYGHARNYAEIALPFAVSRGSNSDIRSLL